MPPMPFVRRAIFPVAMVLSLAACGKGANEGSKDVVMKDLEVVDGTTSDAMTDLDGVRSEGTAMMPSPASNASSAPRPAANAATPAEANAEVIADQ